MFISDEAQFNALKEYLIDLENFSALQNNKFTLFYQEKFQIDLIPFGNIENDDRTVTFPGLTTISTLGLDEVYEKSIEVNIGLDDVFKISTLPGIIILKFIAWEDRPEVRPKDAVDIMHITVNYFKICSEDIYELHNDLFETDSDLLKISSRVLGRHIGEILLNHKILEKRIVNLLQLQLLIYITHLWQKQCDQEQNLISNKLLSY